MRVHREETSYCKHASAKSSSSITAFYLHRPANHFAALVCSCLIEVQRAVTRLFQSSSFACLFVGSTFALMKQVQRLSGACLEAKSDRRGGRQSGNSSRVVLRFPAALVTHKRVAAAAGHESYTATAFRLMTDLWSWLHNSTLRCRISGLWSKKEL
jgi:hypothetical protein